MLRGALLLAILADPSAGIAQDKRFYDTNYCGGLSNGAHALARWYYIEDEFPVPISIEYSLSRLIETPSFRDTFPVASRVENRVLLADLLTHEIPKAFSSQMEAVEAFRSKWFRACMRERGHEY